MPCRRTSLPYPQRAERQIQLVIQHEQIAARINVKLVHQRRDRKTAEVHEGLRLGQNHSTSGDLNLCRERPAGAVGHHCTAIIGDPVYSKKTRIVRRELVFDSRIAETDDQQHARSFGYTRTLFRSRQSLLLRALLRGRSSIRRVRLTLLHHLGLGRGRSSKSIDRRRRFFLDRDHVTHGRIFVAQELQLVAMRQIGNAQHIAKREVRDIDDDVAGNIAWQALDFDFAQHLVENAALGLDADRNAGELDRHFDANGLVEGNALEINVNQVALDRLVLPVNDHSLGLGCRSIDLEVEDGVVAGVRVQDLLDLLGIDFNGDGRFGGSVNNGGNLAPDAYAASCVFVELALTGRGCYDFLTDHFLSLRARNNREQGVGNRVSPQPIRCVYPLPFLNPEVQLFLKNRTLRPVLALFPKPYSLLLS